MPYCGKCSALPPSLAMGLALVRPWARALAATAIVVTMAACATSVEAEPSATPEPTVTPEPTPTLDPAEALLAMCADAPAPDPAAEPVVLSLRANSSGFDKDRLEGARHCEPFTITLKNADVGVEHNVGVEPIDHLGLPLFSGELTPPPQTNTYEIPALPAGEYRFVCNPHRGSMNGILVVSP